MDANRRGVVRFEACRFAPSCALLYAADCGGTKPARPIERAGGECERCRRPHGSEIRCLPDGRWFDPRLGTWRDRRGRSARWPDLEDMTRQSVTRVILAAARLDHDPGTAGSGICGVCAGGVI